MKRVDRQKLCLNCDGRVSFEAIACPYCSNDLSRAPEVDATGSGKESLSRHQAIQNSLTSLYTPPYKGKKGEVDAPSTTTASKSEARVSMPAHHGGMAAEPGATARVVEEAKSGNTILASIASLSLGSLLFILGILQFFFSSEGVLRLEWSTKHWFVYLLASFPILYYGYLKAESKQQDVPLK